MRTLACCCRDQVRHSNTLEATKQRGAVLPCPSVLFLPPVCLNASLGPCSSGHDSSSCTSWNTALGSKSRRSSELDSTLSGQVIDGVVEGAGRAGTSILASESGMSSDLDPSCAGHPADGVAQAPGRTHASRSTAEDSNKAAGSVLATAEQTAILADLHVFSRYTILLTCPLCIFLLVT